MPIKALYRKHGFSNTSFYTWRAKLGGMEVSEARRLKANGDRIGKRMPLCSINSMRD
jgi:hypothetical protein